MVFFFDIIKTAGGHALHVRLASVAMLLVIAVSSAGAQPDANDGWAVIRVESDGVATVTLEMVPPGGDRVLGILPFNQTFHPRGPPLYGITNTLNTEGWVHVEEAGISRVIETGGSSSSPSILKYTVLGPPEVLHFVLLATGDVGAWDYSVDASSFVEISRGASAYYSDGRDFQGGTEATTQVLFSRASVALDRTYPLDLEGHFIGEVGIKSSFLPRGVKVEDIRVVGDGTERKCPCTFGAFSGSNSLPPGGYVIERTIVHAQPDALEYVFFGADVVVPGLNAP